MSGYDYQLMTVKSFYQTNTGLDSIGKHTIQKIFDQIPNYFYSTKSQLKPVKSPSHTNKEEGVS